MPAKRLEVAELEIGAGESDVPQEMVIELLEVMSRAPRLKGLAPGAQNSPDDTGRGSTNGQRVLAVPDAVSRNRATLIAWQ
jgi:hypothetical protein